MMEWWNNDTNKTNPNFLAQYSNIPVVNPYSILPIFRYPSYFSLFWNLRELKRIMRVPKMPKASI